MKQIARQDGGTYFAVPGYYHMKFEGQMFMGQWIDPDFQRCYNAVKDQTTMSIERLWTIYLMAMQCRHVPGVFYECGVFKGGSAKLLAMVLESSVKSLHLFDTFAGMPETDPDRDTHNPGDFADTSVELVRKFVGHEGCVDIRPGRIPDTFVGLEGTPIAFAHIDVDIYQSMKDSIEFIYPRLAKGGVIVFDDYGQPSCPGAREAIDDYFASQNSVPLPIGLQAVVFKI